MKKPANPSPVFLLIPALWIIWAFGIQTVGQRLWLEVNGTIVESKDFPATNAPRYVTKYVIQGAPTTYTAGPTDASLPRSLPVGTKISKQRWHLSYEKNGQIVKDFPVVAYSGTLGVALGFILWSFLQWRRTRTLVAGAGRE